MSYHDHEHLSQSRLKLFARDPQLYAEIYIHKTRPKPEPTPSMQFGTDVEEWLFTGRLSNIVEIPRSVLNTDGHRKGAAWKEWFGSQPDGVECLKRHEYQARILPLVEVEQSIKRHDAAAHWLLSRDETHLDLQWELDGVTFMSELDAMHHPTGTTPAVIVDLKTAADITPDGFARAAIKFGYDVQTYCYREALRQQQNWEAPFVFVVVQNKPSYQVACYEASESFIELGEKRTRQWLDQWKRCRDAGEWQRVDHGKTLTIDPPRWAERNLEEWEVTTG